ncbi:putative ATPase_AAA_core domain-containing protein [Paraburkholderia unamae]|nr:putative ATPase_AAA_core domain-containing protein [Paraburkholderia unamae]
MILRFGLSNYLSIADYQELSFAASNLQDDPAHLIEIDSPSIGKADYLPVVAFYGANAAGKSNFLIGLDAIHDAVSDSFAHSNFRKKANPEGKGPLIGYRPCELSPECRDKNIHLDIDVLIDGVRYHYGFEANKSGYVKEWLYAYPKKARQIIFVRDFDDEEEPFEPGAVLRTKLDGTLRSLAHDKSFLFLSAAGSLKNPILEPIYEYFSKQIVFLHDVERAKASILAGQLQDERIKNFVVRFLEAVDSGIVDIEIKEVERTDEERRAFAGMMSAIEKALKELRPDAPDVPIETNSKDYSIELIHEGIDGERFSLGLGMESSGTLHLLSILTPVLNALERGQTLVIDEITTSLHTMVSQELIKLFSNREINRSGAQFVFSTHDTNLLSSDLLRRDEIWFAEKDGAGRTNAYPLTDFKTRKADNIEKGYLQGRFGGIPYFGDIAALLGNIAGDQATK